MGRPLGWLALLCLIGAPLVAAAGPHDEGVAAGRTANAAARPNVSAADASAVVPGYGTVPPQRSLFGAPDIAGPAGARLQACRANPTDSTCQALAGAVDSANTLRPRINPSDPAVVSARAVASDPLATLGNLLPSNAACATNEASSAGGCPANTFCLGDSCFDTAYTNDADFARSMTMLEASREAGVYIDVEKLTVFNGEGSTCGDRLLKNCCRIDAAGAGMTNQSVFGVGSTLVYDVLTNSANQQFIRQGIASLLSGAGYSGSFTTYGVTVAVEGAAIPVGSTVVASSGTMVVAFDPWSLAIAVIVYVALEAMSCDEGENKLAMKRGAGLCREIGEYCSRRLLGRCLTRKHAHCCFNSKLARIINEQGRVQFAKGWGDAQAPDCSGFSIAQLQSLDFAAMDLSEFYASIVPTLPNLDAIRANNAARAPACYRGKGKC